MFSIKNFSFSNHQVFKVNFVNFSSFFEWYICGKKFASWTFLFLPKKHRKYQVNEIIRLLFLLYNFFYLYFNNFFCFLFVKKKFLYWKKPLIENSVNKKSNFHWTFLKYKIFVKRMERLFYIVCNQNYFIYTIFI